MDVTFYKYHGTGNDFVMIDNREKVLQGDEYEYFAALCHRRFGIGADGVILLNLHTVYDFEMDYFNSDGRRSSMCGNGGRCIVKFAEKLGVIQKKATFLAIDGLHEAKLTAQGVCLKMGLPFGYEDQGNDNFWIDTGSPHHVQFLETSVDEVDVFQQGRALRNSPRYAAEGTNVNFANVLAAGLKVRTYERGVEAETWSCGTGVTAVAEVYARQNEISGQAISITTPGGNLQVHVSTGQAPWLEGPATFVFSGTVEGPKKP